MPRGHDNNGRDLWAASSRPRVGSGGEATNYDRGRAAFGRGEPLSNCPRVSDQKVMHEWRLGWIDAKKGVTREEGDYLAHLDSLEPNAGAAR